MSLYGYQHEKAQCTTKNRYCSLYQQKGHYRKFCPRKGFVHGIYEDSSSNSESECQNSKNPDENLVWTFHLIKISGCNINL